eukprot:441677-Lingulodinium_polyedra.AAC.1
MAAASSHSAERARRAGPSSQRAAARARGTSCSADWTLSPPWWMARRACSAARPTKGVPSTAVHTPSTA